MRLTATILLLASSLAPGCRSGMEARVRAGVTVEMVSIVDAAAKRENGVDALEDLAQSDDPAVRAIALRGLGRIGDADSTRALNRAVTDLAAQARAAAIWGLAVAGSRQKAAWMAERIGIEPDPQVRTILVRALGLVGGDQEVAVLEAALSDADSGVRAAAGLALGVYGRRSQALTDSARATLLALITEPDVAVRYGVVYALAREVNPAGSAQVIAALTTASEDTDPEIRSTALLGLARRARQTADPFVAALGDPDWRVRVQAVRGLVRREATLADHRVLISWLDEAIPAQIAAEVQNPAAAHPILAALEGLSDSAAEPEVQEMYARLTRRVAAESGRASWPLWRAAAHCMMLAGAALGGSGDLESLAACGGPRGGWPMHERMAWLGRALASDASGTTEERLMALTRASGVGDDRAKASVLRATLTATDEVIRGAAMDISRPLLEFSESAALVGTIAGVFTSKKAELDDAMRKSLLARARREIRGDPELMLTLLDALRAAEMREAKDVVMKALSSPHHTVREGASDFLEVFFEESTPDVDDIPSLPVPTEFDPVEWLGLHPRLRLQTTRGEIVIALEPDVAPWAVGALIQLARGGFYRDTLWHRVVPDFVVQGGDPTGSGWGGPGFVLPAEPSTMEFSRGAVGIADAGMDTGGSQWFIMHSRAPHLEGRYTAVGRVVEGLDAVDGLLVGDRVVKVTIEVSTP